jgi:AsmA-like C-terminal region
MLHYELSIVHYKLTFTMSFLKKTFLFLFVFVVLLLAAAIAIPYFYKDKIVAKAKEGINNNLNAKVDFKDIDISLFKHFPQLTVQLNDYKVVGVQDFEGITLAQGKAFDLGCDIVSVVKSAIAGSPVEIAAVHLENPEIYVKSLKNGNANYSITKPTPETQPATASTTQIKLQNYSISDGKLTYDDEALDFLMKMEGINHTGKGDFTSDIFDLATKTDVKAMTVRYEGTTYLSKVKTNLAALINMNLKDMKFTLKDNDLLMNTLRVKGEGWVQLPPGDAILMDMKFNAPSNDFKSYLSIIPGAFIKDFDNVKASGKAAFAGFVKGTYNSVKNQMPIFDLKLDVDNGNVKYPTLPLGMYGIYTNVHINSPNSNYDNVKIDIPTFKLKIGNNPLEGHLFVRTPVSDPDVDGKLKGTLNLTELKQAFPMEETASLAGIIKADVTAKAKMSYAENKEYEKVNVNGTMEAQGITYQPKGKPQVKISNAAASFSPQNVTIPNFEAQLGKSDIKASGTIDNILAYFSTTKTMTGKMNLRSNLLDANEWMSAETATIQNTKVPPTETPAKVEKPFDRFDFTLDSEINTLKYDKFTINNLVTKGNATSHVLKIDDFAMKIGESDMRGNGELQNLMGYALADKLLTGNLNFVSKFLDMNQFMKYLPPTTTTTGTPPPPPADAEPFIVPKNVAVKIDAKVGRMLYTNMDLQDMVGTVEVANEEAKIKNFKANTLGGSMVMSGLYHTHDPKKPFFDLKYAVDKISFKDAFETFNTIKYLAPVTQYIQGKFTTSLNMNSFLGKDMMPDFNTLNALGFLQTLEGLIKNFEPVKQLGNQLNISDYVNLLDLSDTKNYFEIVNGVVEIKPFDLKSNDIALNISGKHSITQNMDYLIKTIIPRKLLDKNKATALANTGIDLLSKEAAKHGANLNAGENVNANIRVSGTSKKPIFKIEMVNASGKAIQDVVKAELNNQINTAKDSVRNVANKKIDEVKERAKKEADKALDSARTVVNKKVQEVTEKAKEKVKEEVGKVINKEVGDKVGAAVGDKVKEKVGEIGGDKAKEQLERAKEKLDKFNPFKKKQPVPAPVPAENGNPN